MINDKPFARVLGLVPLALVLSCGGGAANPDGGGAGATGGSGTGTGGTGGSAGPACSIGQRTPNSTDCAEFANTAGSVMSERAVLGDGGVYQPGGELSTPAGGTLIDGDYELVRAVWGTGTLRTQRTIRLSASGTYTEWVIDQDDPQSDGGVIHYRFNATWTVSGTTLTVTNIGCDGTLNDTFDFTSTGDQLVLFNFNAPAMFVYKRTCVR